MKKDGIEFSDEIDSLVMVFLDEKLKPSLDRLWGKAKETDPDLVLEWVDDAPCLCRNGAIDLKFSRMIRLAALGQKPCVAAKRRPELVKLVQIIELVNDRFDGKLQFN
jgi:hypothetical protein